MHPKMSTNPTCRKLDTENVRPATPYSHTQRAINTPIRLVRHRVQAPRQNDGHVSAERHVREAELAARVLEISNQGDDIALRHVERVEVTHFYEI
jgi:hypothetical protein